MEDVSFDQRIRLCNLYQWNDLSGLIVEFVCELLIVGNQVCDVHITVVLFNKRIFSDLIAGLESASL